jgi:glycosyltransferase involved in cell wall biosynthesis
MITPARNEADNIERLIRSMVAQQLRPVKWVIVSDGSTDGTDDIVKRHAAEHPWIELERRPERKERHFAAKVNAFNAGYARVKDVEHDFVGSMDADISFDAGFFAFLLGKFAENPKLGLGGTPFKEDGLEYDFRYASVEHVSGALQLFRRKCFEQIGGYVPVKGGGIDVIAVWRRGRTSRSSIITIARWAPPRTGCCASSSRTVRRTTRWVRIRCGRFFEQPTR